MGIGEEVFIFGVVMVVCLIDFGVLLYIGIASLFIILIFVLLGCLSFGGIHMNKLGLFVIRSWVIAGAFSFWGKSYYYLLLYSTCTVHIRHSYGTSLKYPTSIPYVSMEESLLRKYPSPSNWGKGGGFLFSFYKRYRGL